MKNEQTNKALALIGIALLMVASDSDTLMFDDAIKKAVLKAIGVDTDIARKEKNEQETSPVRLCLWHTRPIRLPRSKPADGPEIC